MTTEINPKPDDLLLEVFGPAFQEAGTVRNVSTVMRTLYDEETLECLKFASEYSDPIIHDWILKRWTLAYALQYVNEQTVGATPTDRFEYLKQLPSLVVDALYAEYQRIWFKEAELLDLLGKFMEPQVTQSTSESKTN